jgi:hypothetical protein
MNGVDGLADYLDRQGIRHQRRRLVPIAAWAADAPEPGVAAALS